MNSSLDDYISGVIEKGDEWSRLLAARAAPTLKNSPYVQIINNGMNGLSVLRFPEDKCVVVHSAGGRRWEEDVEKHAASLVKLLVDDAFAIGATPIAFADVIDSSTGDIGVLNKIMDGLVSEANRYGLAIMNGENAILGERITRVANVSGTMISIMDKTELHRPIDVFDEEGISYAAFDHENKPAFINSDGRGTKSEFDERLRRYGRAIYDFLAMNLDDCIKKGATAKAVSGVVETSGLIPLGELQENADKWFHEQGIACILQPEDVGDRLQSYKPGVPAYNLSGSVVSIIDEEQLRNPLRPKVGDAIVAISGKPNPRSNGITAKRKIMIDRFGLEWHTTPEGKDYIEYLGEPSIVLYPVFRELLDRGLATSFYHMSGGSYEGKLARPLAEEGLFARLEGLFEP